MNILVFYFKFNLLDGYINNQFVEFNKNINITLFWLVPVYFPEFTNVDFHSILFSCSNLLPLYSTTFLSGPSWINPSSEYLALVPSLLTSMKLSRVTAPLAAFVNKTSTSVL